MNPFKHGTFKIALDTNCPIVPFVLDGTYKVFDAQKMCKKSKVKFSILPPITPLEGEKSQELAERVQNIMQKELERLRNE